MKMPKQYKSLTVWYILGGHEKRTEVSSTATNAPKQTFLIQLKWTLVDQFR